MSPTASPSDYVKEIWNEAEAINESTDSFSKLGSTVCERLNNREEYDIDVYGKKYTVSYESYLSNNNWLNQFKKDSHIGDEHFQQLLLTLNYIPMSPKPERLEQHKITYILGQNHGGYEIDWKKLCKAAIPVNINETKDHVDVMADYFIRRALQVSGQLKDSQANDLPNDLTSYTRFILCGKPGVGKTALLNYTFSKYSTILKENKIIWVRVDLNRAEQHIYTLETMMLAKFVRLFCEYYLTEEKPEFDASFLNIYKQQFKSYREVYASVNQIPLKNCMANVDKFITILQDLRYELITYKNLSEDERQEYDKPSILKYITDEDISERDFKICGMFLMQFVQTYSKYSYIIMFDGLDSVTIDFVRFKAFAKWMAQLDGITKHKKYKFRAVYLVTMRDYSYLYYYRKSKFENPKFVLFSVKPHNLFNILSARADWLARRTNNAITKDQFINILYNLIDNVIRSLNIDSSQTSLSSSRDQRIMRWFGIFCELNNDNVRRAMRILRELVRYSYFIFEESTRKELSVYTATDRIRKSFKKYDWMLMRILLLGSFFQLSYRNRVQFDNISKDHSFRQAAIRIISNCNSMIANVFNCKENRMFRNYRLITKNWIKIRLLQRLEAEGGKCKINDLLEWYVHRFIEPEVCEVYKNEEMDSPQKSKILSNLRCETREMIYNGMISPEVDLCNQDAQGLEIGYRDIENKNYTVGITKHGEVIIRELLYRMPYYEIVIDDTPIEIHFSSGMKPCSTFEAIKNQKIGTTAYFDIKYHAIATFILYLRLLEDKEREYYKKNGHDEVDFNKYAICEKIIRRVTSDMIVFRKALKGGYSQR